MSGRPSRVNACAAAAVLAIVRGCGRGKGADVATGAGTSSRDIPSTVQRFESDIYGASGTVQLPDGRVLIAEDDERNPLAIVDVAGSRRPKYFLPREIKRAIGPFGVSGLNDLEGLAIDSRGHVYGTTSHSANAKGVIKQEREQLVRFDVAGNQLSDVHVYLGLKAALAKLDPLFATAAQATAPDSKGGLNIEGLAWDPEQARLLIGFRSPRRGREALLVWLQNPDAMFERGEAPSLSSPVELSLGGEGIRDVTYCPTLHGFLIAAGAWRHDKHVPPTLWFWRGGAERPLKLQVSGFDDPTPRGWPRSRWRKDAR